MMGRTVSERDAAFKIFFDGKCDMQHTTQSATLVDASARPTAEKMIHSRGTCKRPTQTTFALGKSGKRGRLSLPRNRAGRQRRTVCASCGAVSARRAAPSVERRSHGRTQLTMVGCC
jgi:hypothetical protein